MICSENMQCGTDVRDRKTYVNLTLFFRFLTPLMGRF